MNDTRAGSGDPLLVERVAGFWFACLNRPDKRNALTDEVVSALGGVLDRVAADSEARAVVLCGAGGNFCAGADFAGFQQLMATAPGPAGDPIAHYNRQFGALLEQLTSLAVPTVAVVTGAAIGGGCGLAAACDRVIAADNAVLAMPEVTLGVAPAQIAPFIVRRAGTSRGRWLMLAASRLTAAVAREAGLVDVVAPAADVRAALAGDLRLLAAAEPAAVRATKRIVGRAAAESLGAVLDAAALEFAALLRHGGAREGIAAARQKRAPAWHADIPELPAFL
jgi:isohexenylglutaconyl-CoA hydratase